MKLYLYILKLFLLKKELFNKYIDYIDLEDLRSSYPELLRLFNVVKRLQENNHESVQFHVVDLEAGILSAYPNFERDLLQSLLAQIEGSEANEGSVVEYLESLAERVAAKKLAFLALDVFEGKAQPEQLRSAIQEQVVRGDRSTSVYTPKFVTDNLEELYATTMGEGGLRWRLKSLNRSLGPLRKGDFGFIFARPETGKTTFLADQFSCMAIQAPGPCLWFNNEEQGEKVAVRLYQSVLGAPLEKIYADRGRAQAAYLERTGGRIKVVDDAGISKRDIERTCESVQPSLIVIDQLDKVHGFDADRDDLRLGAIYQWARELAKSYGPVIGVSQSDGSGEGVKYLNMGNVANAKTSKQAEADWILGIGLDFKDHPMVRGFSICKNKLMGGEESVAKYRHGKWDVMIEPEIARYKDMAHVENN